MKIKEISEEQALKYIKYCTILLCCMAVLGVFVAGYMFWGVRDCNITYANITEYGFQNEASYAFDPFANQFDYIGLNLSYQKYMDYEIEGNVTRLEFHEVATLDQLNELYPVEKEYIMVFCEQGLQDIIPKNFINTNFFYKLAKLF